jgi:hypothetical protein
MKFVCNECKELVSEEDVVVYSTHDMDAILGAGAGWVEFYHASCWPKAKKWKKEKHLL